MIGIPGLARMVEAVSTAFKSTWAQMTDIFLQEHDEDGAHTDITAHSITVSENEALGATGDIQADGNLSVDGSITALASTQPIVLDLNDSSDPAVDIQESSGARWQILVSNESNLGALRLRDMGDDSSVPPPTWHVQLYESTTGEWTLIPHSAISLLNLGLNVSGSRLNNVDAALVRALSGFEERGRTAKVGESTAYTPTWSSMGSAPALGNGSISGRYTQVGKMVFFQIQFSYGGTSTPGTGPWTFSLPVTAVGTTFPGAMPAVLLDNGTAHYVANARLVTTTTVSLITDTSNGIGDGSPFTWAAGDTISIDGWYMGA